MKLTIQEWKKRFEERYPTYKFRVDSMDYLETNNGSEDLLLIHTNKNSITICDGMYIFMGKELDISYEVNTDEEVIELFDLNGNNADFKDNIERLKYIADMKIRLATEFEEISLDKTSRLFINHSEKLNGNGTIWECEELNTITIWGEDTTKHDYINFEQKVRKYFAFDLVHELAKWAEEDNRFDMMLYPNGNYDFTYNQEKRVMSKCNGTVHHKCLMNDFGVWNDTNFTLDNKESFEKYKIYVNKIIDKLEEIQELEVE